MIVCLELSIFLLKQSGSVSGQSLVSLWSVSGQSQVGPRSVSGPRSLIGLSELTSSVRRSLKYFVLLLSHVAHAEGGVVRDHDGGRVGLLLP